MFCIESLATVRTERVLTTELYIGIMTLFHHLTRCVFLSDADGRIIDIWDLIQFCFSSLSLKLRWVILFVHNI